MLNSEIDHPFVRKSARCICCGGTKDIGLVLCWPCHRRQKGRYGGYSATIAASLEATEMMLRTNGGMHQ